MQPYVPFAHPPAYYAAPLQPSHGPASVALAAHHYQPHQVGPQFQAGGCQCLHCLAKGDTIPCGATLIVTPQAIIGQWEQELYKHTSPGTLNVLVYRGVKASASAVLHPLHLAP